MGIYIQGYFIMQEVVKHDDGNSLSVIIAIGANTYRVYMCDDYDPGILADEKVGEKISIRARPYVNKKSRLVWIEGEIA